MAPLPSTAPRIILTTLNARYIHASLGLRYLLANLDQHGGAGLRAQTVLREYTISRPTQEAVADLLATLDGSPALPDESPEQGPDVVASAEAAGEAAGQQAASRPVIRQRQIIGFGVYIWNVSQTSEVIRQLKAARPDVTVVLGGPEVSHETDQQAITALADFVITGWGDVSFAKLCRALISGPQPLMKVIAGEQPALADLELPYLEYSAADLAHRLLYVEASRGCPYRCEFCLSALDKTAWAFELDRVLVALEGLYQRGARNFKFVDRTFNLKIEHSARILQFFLDKLALPAAHVNRAESANVPMAGRPVAEIQPGRAEHLATFSDATAGSSKPALFLHFEVIPDHLPDRLKTLLAQFPPGVLQLEVGVQSFNEAVQKTISRRQDNTATEANLRWLLAHSHAHLHADLIFGLPGETLPSFADGFDRLLAIGPHEIQLGILKRLRGAPVARHTEAHGMVYAAEPPYTVQQTGVVDAGTLARFTRFARYWDLLANSGRFAQTLSLVLQTSLAVRCVATTSDEPTDASETSTSNNSAAAQPNSPFWRFMALSDWLWQRLDATHKLTPEALVDALFDYLSQHLPPDMVRQALLADYLASGAKSNPKALHGLLLKPTPSPAKATRTLATRQQRHQTAS